MTEARGWWAPLSVLVLSAVWQGTVVASDCCLAYGISGAGGEKAAASQFIRIYDIMPAASVVLMLAWSFLIVFLGLEISANKFFKEILNSILHAPMSIFDTTPSGRVLSRVRRSVWS